jgi:hypothetical protein
MTTYADGRRDALSIAIKMAEAEKVRMEKTGCSDACRTALDRLIASIRKEMVVARL